MRDRIGALVVKYLRHTATSDTEIAGPIQRLTGNWLQSVKSMPIAYPAGPREQR